MCCLNVKISIPSSNMPEEIKQLFIGDDDTSKNFRNNILQYNSATSFAPILHYHLIMGHTCSKFWELITEYLHYTLKIQTMQYIVNISLGTVFYIYLKSHRQILTGSYQYLFKVMHLLTFSLPLTHWRESYVMLGKNSPQNSLAHFFISCQ